MTDTNEIKDEVVTGTETMEDFAGELEASFRKISEGDIITGTVLQVSEDGVILDLKYFAPGFIRTSDCSNDPNFTVFEEIKEGDVLSATVVRLDDGKGNILLSLKEATEVLAWDKLGEYKDNEEILSLKISGIVNGGVIVYAEGIRGFIPASQLSVQYVEDLNTWLHKEVEARIITLEKDNNRLVLSSKVVEQEHVKDEMNHKMAMLVPGTVMEGTVDTLMPYGAFVKLADGLSGLVHISQISQKRITKPSEVLNEGDKIKVKLLNIKDGKLSLSMKALEEESIAVEEVFELPKTDSASTSLEDLLKNIKLDS